MTAKALRIPTGVLLKHALAGHGVSLAAIARTAGVAVSTISRICSGQYPAGTARKRDTVCRVIRLIGVTLGQDLSSLEPQPDAAPCGHPDHRTVRTCSACKKANRVRNPPRSYRELTPEQRRKSITRSYSKVLTRRGHLKPKPCRDCGAAKAQRHHPDYHDPRRVIWLCPACHRAEHKRLKRRNGERETHSQQRCENAKATP